MASEPGWRVESDSPLRGRMIFVVGARRSGTNLVERILAVHPDVVAIVGETYLFSHGVSALAERVHHGARGSSRVGSIYTDEAEFLASVRALCDTVFAGYLGDRAPNGCRLVERTPEHVHHLDLIGRVYPDAAVVHVLRDGRDVARSLRSHRWGPAEISAAALEWRSAIDDARRSTVADRLLEVRYEDLLAAPEAAVRGLFGGLGLGTGPDVIEAAVIESRVWYNVDPRARSVEVGKWRSSLSARELAAFLDVAGETLTAVGYDAGLATVPAPTSPRSTRVTSAVRSLAHIARHVARPEAQNLEAQVVAWLTDHQVVVDELLGAMAHGDQAGIAARLSPTARVRLVGPEGEWVGRGAEAARRLLDEFDRDAAIRGRQVRGDVFPALPTFTVVLDYDLGDGVTHPRLLMVHLDDRKVTGIEWYRGSDRPG